MSKIALVGKLTADAKRLFYEKGNNRYDILEITSSEEIPKIKDAEYIVVRGIPFMQPEISLLSNNTKLIHRWGVGYDSVDIKAAGEKGITVAVSTGGNAQPVAELTVLLMLASYRCLPDLLDRAKAGSKDKEDIIAKSYLLQGKRVGLVGFGNIGSKVCKMVQAFGAEVQYYDKYRISSDKEKEIGVKYISFEDLLKTSDIVSIHVPLMESTRHLIGQKEFEIMKPTALLVNTARGGVVDTEALLAALDGGEIAAAALDTIEGEPLPKDHPIFNNNKVILTPHGGGNTCDNTINMVNIIMENIDSMENGDFPSGRYVVNNEYLKH